MKRRFIRDGRTKSPLHEKWRDMIKRCKYPKNKAWPSYGGRGIRVCHRWMDFSKFREDMESSYRPGMTLERVNVDGHYAPSNCRWASWKEQWQNMRKTIPRKKRKLIFVATGSQDAIALRFGVSQATVSRIKRRILE